MCDINCLHRKLRLHRKRNRKNRSAAPHHPLGDRVQQTVNVFRVNEKMAFFINAQVEWAGADALRGDEHHARGIGNSGSTRYALSCAWSLWSRKCR